VRCTLLGRLIARVAFGEAPAGASPNIRFGYPTARAFRYGEPKYVL